MEPSTPLIAVVDDEESVRRAIERLFRSAGLSVATFAGGVELMSGLEKAVPDCVVLDLHMPGLSGYEVMALLPEALPVVVMTGHDSPEAQAGARRAAFYLCKPVDDQVLLDSVSSAMRRTFDLKPNPADT